jgi:peptidoglycan/xylan/chitin deacetylase (PgdA/CDA1 family)
MLTGSELAELVTQGWEVGSHGVTHRRLDELARAEVAAELANSRAAVEDCTGQHALTYAYPHGSHTEALARLVAEAGYSSAAAVRDCLSADDDNPYALGRMTVMSGLDVAGLRSWLEGTELPEFTPTPRAVTEAYRAIRRLRARMRGRALDELDERLATVPLA